MRAMIKRAAGLSKVPLGTVYEAANGAEALRMLETISIDALFTDINMPVMNGVQAAYEIRRIAPATKIIFFTVHDSPEAVAACRTVGVDAFVPKAAAGTQLIPTVERLLKSA